MEGNKNQKLRPPGQKKNGEIEDTTSTGIKKSMPPTKQQQKKPAPARTTNSENPRTKGSKLPPSRTNPTKANQNKPKPNRGSHSKRSNTTGHPPVEVDTKHFTDAFGPMLLTKRDSKMATGEVLLSSKPRLIGVYFSASWCGSCRQFTPLIAEMYSHLKKIHPTNGLEIVLCSADRDKQSFETYYAKQPWKAIPFEQATWIKRKLNLKYNLRGIPAFVIVDAATGKIVVPGRQSLQEILEACGGRGEQGLEELFAAWVDRVNNNSRLIDQYNKPKTVLGWIQAKRAAAKK